MTQATLWTQHLRDPKARKEFNSSLHNLVHSPAFDRLQDILRNKIQTIEWSNDFDNPNWAFLQAFNNGQRQALKQILDLIDLTDDN